MGTEMQEKADRWNKFVMEVCFRDLDTLSEVQRKAVLCCLYDNEMNSGGFSGYLDMYEDTDFDELEDALREIASDEIAGNFHKAYTEGEEDDYEATDMEYYRIKPSLTDYLEIYVEEHKDEILL